MEHVLNRPTWLGIIPADAGLQTKPWRDRKIKSRVASGRTHPLCTCNVQRAGVRKVETDTSALNSSSSNLTGPGVSFPGWTLHQPRCAIVCESSITTATDAWTKQSSCSCTGLLRQRKRGLEAEGKSSKVRQLKR